jgi:1-acyl-sn-glycerol-3-phosphate acyltransferase
MSAGEFPRPFPIQFSGSRLACWLLKQLGWRVLFEGLPALQGVLVVYPHTSNWDFVVLVLVKWAVGIPVRFLGKDKLFHIPLFGRWMRWLGGVPVNRTSSRGIVGQAVDQIGQARAQGRYFWLTLSPEGTRKRIPGWRSGFYQIVLKSRVPLGLVRLDYREREVMVQDFVYLTGDETEDFRRIASVYHGVTGYIAQNAAPIRLLHPSVSRSETIVK